MLCSILPFLSPSVILKVKNDHRSKFSNLSNWKEEAWKKSGLQRNSNPWPPRYRCIALPTELWSHSTHWGFFFPIAKIGKFTAMIILHFHLQLQFRNELFHICFTSVILLPLRPASLIYKKPQRCKITHGMRPVEHKDRLIDLKMFL